MRDEELNELLATIDQPTDSPADAEERVWRQLRGTYFAPTPVATPPGDDEAEIVIDDEAEIVVLDDIRRSTPEPAPEPRWRSFAVAAVAAIVVLVIGIGAVLVIDDDRDLQIADDPGTTLDDSDSRPDACFRFRSGSPLFADLEKAITDDPPSAPELIDQTREGLDRLRADLDAIGRLTPALRDETFPLLDGALNQARLFIQTEDVAAARQSIDFAESTYAQSELAVDDCLG